MEENKFNLYGIGRLIEEGVVRLEDFELKDGLTYFNWAKALAIFSKEGGKYDYVDFGNGKYWLDTIGTTTEWVKKPGASKAVKERNTTPVQMAQVFVKVTYRGVEHTSSLPVMDFKNNPIVLPNPFELNTAKQRCLAKAIAEISGLGLELWADPTVRDAISEAINREGATALAGYLHLKNCGVISKNPPHIQAMIDARKQGDK